MDEDRALRDLVARTIESRMGDPHFSVGELAAAVGMSRSRLHRRLVRNGGLSPGAWIRRARLERAATLLRTTDQPVGRIASAVGYTDPAHFTRSFKRERGLTPSAFRDRGNPHGSATEERGQQNGKGSRREFNRDRPPER